MKASAHARELARRLRPLDSHPLSSDELARVHGGGRETASTSTSGTPAAGDDTVGDSGGSSGGGTDSFTLNFSKIEFEY